MPETEAKYHHLIPQTYMTAWANESGTMDVEFLRAPGKIVKRNKERIAGITDFHSIQAGMPLCTENDTNELFAAVTGYTEVLISGQTSKKARFSYMETDLLQNVCQVATSD